jgi:PAS domain S-box-containing protein
VFVLADGLVLAAVPGVFAVTTRRRRRAMREVERYFTLSPEMVVLAGFDGYWKRVNPTVEAVLGYTEREALARPFMEFVHPGDRKRTEEEARRVVGGASAFAFENRIVCKDGSYKCIEWTVTPVPEERVMFGVGRDVTERRRSESEQAALRRLATLVAQEAPQAEVFGAIAEEIGRLLGTEEIRMLRFDSESSAVVVGSSGRRDMFPLGSRHQLEGDSVAPRVLRTGRTARIDDYTKAGGPLAETVRSLGIRAVVGAPILVEGRLWGAILTRSTSDASLPPDTESRLLDFTELMATAIANAQARETLQRLADEQAALRRVATLVAQGVPPAELFSAVTKEVAQVFSGVEPPLVATVIRFDPGPECVLVGASRPYEREPIGSRWTPKDLYVSTRVLRTGRSARVDEVDLESVGGPAAEVLRLRRFLCQVGSPVVVEGRLWGAMTLNSKEALPPDTDERLENFTELVATAIANAESREALARLADEQAALRRIATLVAKGVQPEQVFAAVTEEVAATFRAITAVMRFDHDPPGVVLVGASKRIDMIDIPIGARWDIDDALAAAEVFRTGRSARVDRVDSSSAGGAGAIGEALRRLGLVSSVASPIIVEGSPWGVITVNAGEQLPPETEQRLEKFTDLVTTAIANAEGKSELAASRRRIVAASDATRRRIERNLHDGTQQRLVSLGLAVRAAEANLPPERDDLRAQLSGVATGLVAAVEDLQEISRGIHPAILSHGGLGPALQVLARRSAIPVDLDFTIDVRVTEPIEVAAYYVASEALANAAKHSQASRIDVSLAQRDQSLLLSVRDDGVGGADTARGSGLVGLMEALGGSIRIDSRPGGAPRSRLSCRSSLRCPRSASTSRAEGFAGSGDADGHRIVDH